MIGELMLSSAFEQVPPPQLPQLPQPPQHPGKLNPKDFANVADAIARMKLVSSGKECPTVPPPPPPRLAQVNYLLQLMPSICTLCDSTVELLYLPCGLDFE